jgi:hypothetical protein
MGYKLLGFIVWRAAKWYLRRRYGGHARKAAIGALVVGGVAAALVAQRRASGS